MQFLFCLILIHGGSELDFSYIYNSDLSETGDAVLSSQDRRNEVEKEKLALAEDYNTLSFFSTTRRVTGWTRVREFDSTPTRLDFEDMSLDKSSGYALEYTKMWTNWKLSAIFEHFPIEGTGEFPFDIVYDEGNFIANRPFDIVNGKWYHFSAFIDWIPEFLKTDRERFAIVTGIRFDQFHLGLDNGLDHSTEDYTQFLPYPLLGVNYERRLLPGVCFQLRATGSTIPKSRTFQIEGSEVYMRVNQSDIQVRLGVNLTESIQLIAGFGYLTWRGSLESSEDGNDISMRAPSYNIGIAYSW